MSHYALLGDYRFGNAAEDIRGASLYGLDDKGQGDEKLGKIQDVIFQSLERRYWLCCGRYRRMADDERVRRCPPIVCARLTSMMATSPAISLRRRSRKLSAVQRKRSEYACEMDGL